MHHLIGPNAGIIRAVMASTPNSRGHEALVRLQQGNARFVESVRTGETLVRHVPWSDSVPRQNPFAIVLGCSDARVPAEIIFDQGLGDLFVIRVAGNVVAPSQIGSVEFAAEQFGTPLVVVLGHTHCGAVEATIQELQRSTENRSPNLRAIVDRIRPAVQPLMRAGLAPDPDRLMREAVRAHVRIAAAQLSHGSQIIERLVEARELLVVSAEYSLETGIVDFFDDAS
jgi:carbonic anhydrase